MGRVRTRVLLVLLVGMLLPDGAGAAPANFVPYAEVGGRADSNIFRVTDDAEALEIVGETDTSDTIRYGVLGLALEWPLSRQRFVFGVEGSEFRYSQFEQLDHSETEARAAWDFQFGSPVYGIAEVERTRELDDFADRTSDEPDFLTRLRPRFELFAEISPRWRVRSLLEHERVEHSLEPQQRFDRREDTVLAELQYAGAPGSAVGLGVEVTDGEYPERGPGDPLSQSFRQETLFSSVSWEYSGVSHLAARLGHTRRDDKDGSRRDFSAMTGSLAYERTVSGKTAWSAELYRRIYSVDNVDAIAVEQTGGEVEVTWRPGTRTELSARLARSNQDYVSLPGTAARDRSDTVNEIATELVWRPRRLLSLVLELGAEQRDSNQPDEEYDAVFGGIALRLTFDADRNLQEGEPLPGAARR